MGKAFSTPKSMSDNYTHYCPGCTHGIVHRLVAETIDELGIAGRTVGIAPVGCAVLAYNYFNFDFQEAAHGRAPAMATGMKRVRPDLIVFTYRETVTLPVSVWVKSSMRPTEVKNLPPFLLTMPSTA